MTDDLGERLLDQLAAAVEWLQAIHAQAEEQTTILSRLVEEVADLNSRMETIANDVDLMSGVTGTSLSDIESAIRDVGIEIVTSVDTIGL